MKKFICILALALTFFSASAQRNVIVFGQAKGNNVSNDWVLKLKSSIVEGLVSSGRLDVVDGATLSNLSANAAEAIVQLRDAGAQYYMEATVETITKSSSSKDGKTTYTAKMEYAYQIYEVASSSVIASAKKEHYGTSYDGYDAAIASSFSLVDNDMRSMVNNVFRVGAEIKAVNETHPRKGIVSVYVSAGSSDGVAKGTIFEVFKIMEVAGEKITEKIGEMKIAEVKSASLSLCNVTKGGKEIQSALDDEIPIQIVSRPGLINNILGF